MRLEWPTLGLIALTYGSWAAAGLWLWPIAPLLALAVMAVLAALQSSLVHECLHGHPTANSRVNEALVALPLYLVYPYRRYRATHMAHHHDPRLTDPFDDPESYYRARWQVRAMPRALRALLTANTTMLGRLILGPWIAAVGFFASELRLAVANAPGLRRAWALHLPAVALVLAAVWAMGIPLWAYVLGVVWPSLSLIAIRTYAEHRWHEDPSGRTIIVERSPLAWLFLHNNLHIVHHLNPKVAWYALPALYAARRAEFRAANHGYWYPDYWTLFRAHALRAKEPLAHPALRLEPGPADLPPASPPPTNPTLASPGLPA
jgi:fatty acid desaturase